MKNNSIIKYDDLVEARYKLNLAEQKLILYSASKMKLTNNNFKMVKLEIEEIRKLLQYDSYRYSEFSVIINRLMDKKIQIKNRPNLDIRWLASSELIDDEDIYLEFSEKLIPYLLNLKETFINYELENIINFENKHSLRIYELMKQYQKVGKKSFQLQLEEFKQILFLENQYERIYDFERFVLNPAKEEINNNTDLNIDYNKIKTGKIITSIEFIIK